MQDPVSRDLLNRLRQFTSCTERDLANCRSYVRRLSQDLPAFDSLWLDALVQARRLTPFQADRLAAGNEQSLQVGSYQLVDQMMQDRVHLRYWGRHVESGKRILVEEHRQQQLIVDQVRTSLLGLKDRLSRLPAGSCVLVPQDFVIQEKTLYAIYPFERGLTARELLIRRGRFPEKLIRLLTHQLLQQLQVLHSAGCVHGDLRASNLMLNHRGQITLLNAGLRPYLTPHWTIQTECPFEVYDTLAPEVVRTGQWSMQADLYSAGCLLWQLTCGRPPLHSADPLLKLKAHLTRSIPDVREYAPDVDAQTAETIFRLTRLPADQRDLGMPVGQEWQQSSGFSARHVLRSFIQEFERPLPAMASSAGGQRRQSAVLAVTACLLIAGLWQGARHLGWEPAALNGARPWLLSITAQGEKIEPVHSEKSSETASGIVENPLAVEDLPEPNEQGQVRLEPGHLYRARDLAAVGPLWISTTTEEGQSAPEAKATIIVSNQPWRLWATDLVIDNLAIEYGQQSPMAISNADTGPNSTPSHPGALLVCQSQNFRANRCRWKGLPESEASKTTALRSIAWKPLEAEASQGSQLQLFNCQFLEAGNSLMIGGPARMLTISNCLKTGGGTFVELADQFSGAQFPRIQCEHLTLREADSLVNLHFYTSRRDQPVELTVQGVNSVFQLSERSAGLITFSGSEDPADRVGQCDVIGQILLVQNGKAITGWWNPETGSVSPVEVPGTLEGILPYEIQFAGLNRESLQGSEISDYNGPRWNSVAPGIKSAEMTNERKVTQ